MGLFSKQCTTCKTKENLKRCPFCKKDVCETCLKPLVGKEDLPGWFTGREVTNYLEFAKLIKEYVEIFKGKGIKLHNCDEFSKVAWHGIVQQVRKYKKDSNAKITKVTLR